MMQELRPVVIRVRNALRRPAGTLQRLCRVRVLFPDIGRCPVVEDVAFERECQSEAVRDFPTPYQVVEHLAGLTTP